jgi:hypothetical protein
LLPQTVFGGSDRFCALLPIHQARVCVAVFAGQSTLLSMGKHRKRHASRTPTWSSLKVAGLSERHVLMAQELGLEAKNIQNRFHETRSSSDLLLLEWIEDVFLEKFGRCFPVDESALPALQAEHPSDDIFPIDEQKIMNDYLYDHAIVAGSDDEPEWYGEVGRLIEEAEKNTPVTRGEIAREDLCMLRRQDQFRKAARLLTKKLADMPPVRKVVLFGSVALPLWKEVPMHSRMHSRRIKIFHECENIDLAVWVSTPSIAATIRRAHSAVVNELLDNEVHFEIAHHFFSTHLIDDLTGKYHGMVCHYGQCPKRQKEVCRVPGCGEHKFVRVLPGFRLKPERLHTHNSQVLFERT